MSRYTWLLDPGHGGMIDGVYQTSGKRSPPFEDGSILYEGVFNRDIAKRIIELCKIHDIDVVNVADSEEDVSLRSRVKLANSVHKVKKNGIYISIHANAFGRGREFSSPNGISIYHYYGSKTGKKLAEILMPHLVSLTGFRKRGVKANDTWANFYVLRKTRMPAILSENGFMTNLQNATALMTDETREKIAVAHFAMILEIEQNGL